MDRTDYEEFHDLGQIKEARDREKTAQPTSGSIKSRLKRRAQNHTIGSASTSTEVGCSHTYIQREAVARPHPRGRGKDLKREPEAQKPAEGRGTAPQGSQSLRE